MTMKKFKIKSLLAHGLTHRMKTMDGQTVVDACLKAGHDAIKAVRNNLAIADKIDAANKTFFDAVEETEQKKRAIFADIKKDYDKKSEGKTAEEAGVMARGLQVEFGKRAADVQKESKADPDEIVEVEIGDEDYEEMLMPIFKKTVQLWDVNGDGNGQRLFIEVADALEAATDC